MVVIEQYIIVWHTIFDSSNRTIWLNKIKPLYHEFRYVISFNISNLGSGWRLWCITPLSTIFIWIVAVSRSYLWRKPEKTYHLPQITDQLYHIMFIEYTSPLAGFELSTIVIIGTDCKGSCKSNYHSSTTTTAPISPSNICSISSASGIVVLYLKNFVNPLQNNAVKCCYRKIEWLNEWVIVG